MQQVEHLLCTVPSELQLKSEKIVISYGLIAAFFILVLSILAYLYPGNTFINTLSNERFISEPDIQYSLLFLNRYHNNNQMTYQEILNNPSVILKHLEENLQEENLNQLWYQYIILKTILYQPKIKKPVKILARSVTADYLKRFKTMPTTFRQDLILAGDSLAIKNPQMALYYYEKAIAQNPNEDAHFYANVAQTALWAEQCVKSAEYYFVAEEKSTILLDKRYFFILALKLLFDCKQYELALSSVEKHIDGLINDDLTYHLLTRLAIRANEPKEAQKFVLKLLQLRESKHNLNTNP